MRLGDKGVGLRMEHTYADSMAAGVGEKSNVERGGGYGEDSEDSEQQYAAQLARIQSELE